MKPSKEIAVVVGATGAFGREIVSRLSAYGLDVVAVARRSESLVALANQHPQLIPCEADIAEDSAIDLIRGTLDRPVRLVVHGPGVSVAGGVLDASISALNAAVNIKVGGMMRLVRAVDGHLQRRSRLVAIGGHYGFEPSAYAAAAGVANAALANLSRQLSLVYGARGITSHLLAPGPADTERLRRVAADRGLQEDKSVDTVLAEMCAESSLGALTTPQQVAWAVSVLLAPEADAMTGSALMLDSGRRRGTP